MMTKISGLARALYIVLAIVAAFVALGGMNVPLALLVLGLIAGLSMTEERLVPAAVIALVLPIVGAALAQLPSVGAQLNAVAANLQMGVAGALATGLAMFLYHLVMKDVTGLTGAAAPATGRKAAAAR
jgi:hypothetical protein